MKFSFSGQKNCLNVDYCFWLEFWAQSTRLKEKNSRPRLESRNKLKMIDWPNWDQFWLYLQFPVQVNKPRVKNSHNAVPGSTSQLTSVLRWQTPKEAKFSFFFSRKMHQACVCLLCCIIIRLCRLGWFSVFFLFQQDAPRLVCVYPASN